MTLLHMYNNFIHTDIHVTKLLPYTSSICDFTYVNKISQKYTYFAFKLISLIINHNKRT